VVGQFHGIPPFRRLAGLVLKELGDQGAVPVEECVHHRGLGQHRPLRHLGTHLDRPAPGLPRPVPAVGAGPAGLDDAPPLQVYLLAGGLGGVVTLLMAARLAQRPATGRGHEDISFATEQSRA
jgi:hypothetical protein